MSRLANYVLRLVPADEGEAVDLAADDERRLDLDLDLGVESGAIFGLPGPRGAVWASIDGGDRDAEPPETPEAA